MHIPITKPNITEREYELVRESLSSGWLVQGPKVKEFEDRIAQYTGAKYAIAVNSCTSGQFIMSRILNLQPGDEVILPAFTWISTANAIEYLGAKPVFCDISLDTFNIDTSQVENLITSRTKAIYPVNLFGLAADLKEIQLPAKRYDLEIVEDCACGLGAYIDDTHCGLFGRAGVFSFHPRKSITTGEGGMIITNDSKVNKLARSLRDHGADISDYERHTGSKSFRMGNYSLLGYNMRMTDMQGALGIAQTEKLEGILADKDKLALEFHERLSGISWLQLPHIPDGYRHTFQTYCTLYKPQETFDALDKRDESMLEKLHEERNALMSKLEEKGIMTRPGTHTVHIQEYYQKKYGFHPMDFPHSYAADRLTMALPFYSTMNQQEKEYLFHQLNNITP
jgi:dTDP-4-amino-4,6-dideoxygalactose transaminase